MKNIFYSLLCLLLINSCSRQIDSDAVKDIYFDSKNCVNKLDIAGIMNGNYKIIALETLPECLISNIDKIEIKNDKIFIQDKMAQSIFIFDMDGHFSGKIKKTGRGPGEYVNLSYMTVTDSAVIVVDHFSGKQIIYDMDSLAPVDEEYIMRNIWCHELFCMNNVIYYINDWSDSSAGKYRLFSYGRTGGDFEKHLPFETEPNTLGINGPVYGIDSDEALIIYSGDDFIYRATDDGVSAAYRIVFKNNRVKYSAEVGNTVNDNAGKNLIYGINAINDSDNYIFLNIATTNPDKTDCIYDKTNDVLTIYNYAYNSNISESPINIKKVVDNAIIDWYGANSIGFVFSDISKEKGSFASEMNKIITDIDANDNPVLFIYELKKL